MKVIPIVIINVIVWLTFVVKPAQSYVPLKAIPIELEASRFLDGCTISAGIKVKADPRVRWVVIRLDDSRSQAWRIGPDDGLEVSTLFVKLKRGAYKVEGILYSQVGGVVRVKKEVKLEGC